MKNNIKICLIKEGKRPIDRRVPLTPEQAAIINEKYTNVTVYFQPSDIRCFSDDEYINAGIMPMEDPSQADILLGVKEVPKEWLIEGKTYLFFSHTIKMQEYNRELLQKIIEKDITLIDYEVLTNPQGARVVAFGRWAGIVGAYNGILTYGKRYHLFELKRAKDCFDLKELKNEYDKVNLPPIKIALTGGGRVAKGAMEVLNGIGIRKVSPEQFIEENYDHAVYTQLSSMDYYKKKGDGLFNKTEFHNHPERYYSTFLDFTKHADLLIAGAYWDPSQPVLFKQEDMLDRSFKIKVIADITCDIEGSIPSTIRPSTIDSPFYDYNQSEGMEETPFSDEANVTVMAVDNLPCELPRDASEDFGRQLTDNVIGALTKNDIDNLVIKNATITKGGKLTSRFSYLQHFADGK
ncbi:NAD(P)-dependent oxidoreductase [Mangrovivirga sp. M17]|uniref:Saccharopine dehydrogenase [NAD(+), L-lysine-forming] n=1 Tax=Mangrovivirga halotolerans TaxID=2993936 RepID=A0ABT3RSR6_9BACT|nr:NAD(P)-dependent oxidoreductase [Mangrovivirga halotolerans]MCX2744836.1 NAD(P)-dependent oxidoreductase [Mangrovivirga halotolerans]